MSSTDTRLLNQPGLVATSRGSTLLNGQITIYMTSKVAFFPELPQGLNIRRGRIDPLSEPVRNLPSQGIIRARQPDPMQLAPVG